MSTGNWRTTIFGIDDVEKALAEKTTKAARHNRTAPTGAETNVRKWASQTLIVDFIARFSALRQHARTSDGRS